MRRHILIFTLLAAACGPAEDQSSESPAQEAAPAEPRVVLAPTAPGELPPAIVGEGGALQGSDLRG